MMTLTKKYNRYLIATAAIWLFSLLVVGGGYLMFYRPQNVELVRTTNQYEESQKAMEEAKLASQQPIKAKQKQKYEDVLQLISGFSTQQDLATELVFEIGRIANELRLIDFSSKTNGKQNYSTVGQSKRVSEAWLDVDFFANFEQFAEFINRLESNSPVVFVEEIAFRRGSRDDKGNKVSLKLSFLTETDENNTKVASAAN
jgi:hypothetical protein